MNASREFYHEEDLTLSTYNTDTNYQDKLTLTFTPQATADYLIIASWTLKASVTSSYISKAKLVRTSGTPLDFHEQIFRPTATTDWEGTVAVAVESLTASTSYTYKVQYGTTDTNNTASIKNVSLVAIKLTSDDVWTSSTGTSTNALTTYTNKCTAAVDPTTTGDYLILGSCTTYQSSTSGDEYFVLDIDSSEYCEIITRCRRTSARTSNFLAHLVTLAAQEEPHSIKTKFKSNSTSYTCTCRQAWLVCLRVDGFPAILSMQKSDATTTTNATTSYVEAADSLDATLQSTVSHWLKIGWGRLGGSSTSYYYSGESYYFLSSAGELECTIRQPASTSERFPICNAVTSTYTPNGTNVMNRIKTSNASGTATIYGNRIFFLQLEANPTYSKTPALAYKVKTTATKQPTLAYKIKTTTTKQPTLAYKVKSTPTKQSTLAYKVKTIPSTIQKTLDYSVIATTVFKTLVYKVKFIPSTIQKTLNYKVNYIPSTIQKALSYKVKYASSAYQRTLAYVVKFVPSTIQKSLAYKAKTTPSATQKSLAYKIKYNPSTIQKTLEYRVKLKVGRVYYTNGSMDETGHQTSSTEYQDGASITFIPQANASYLILAQCELNLNSTSYAGKVRIYDGSTALSEVIHFPAATTDYVPLMISSFVTYGSSPTSQTIKLQYCSSDSGATCTCRNDIITIIKLASTDKTASSTDRSTVTGITWTDKATLTFTPDTAGDYYIFSSAQLDIDTINYSVRARIDIDGTAKQSMALSTLPSTSEKYLYQSVYKTNLTAASHTIKIQFSSYSTGKVCGIQNAYVVAIRADEFPFTYNSYTDTTIREYSAVWTALTSTQITETVIPYNYLVVSVIDFGAWALFYPTWSRTKKDSGSPTTYGITKTYQNNLSQNTCGNAFVDNNIKDATYYLYFRTSASGGDVYSYWSDLALIPLQRDPWIQKTLAYKVNFTPSTIQKALAYKVKSKPTIQKGMVYALPTQEYTIQKDLDYTVPSTSTYQRNLLYKVLKQYSTTKNLVYKIFRTYTDTKDLKYKVPYWYSKTKDLVYKVKTLVTPTKSIVYKVLSTSSAQKGLEYVVIAANTINKGLSYRVFLNPTIQKGTIYRVKTLPSAIQKALAYKILFTDTEQKGLIYKVFITPTIQKNLVYRVFLTPTIQKALVYKVPSYSTYQRSLAYVIKRLTTIQKTLVYKVPTWYSDTKDLDYVIKRLATIQKGLIYRVKSFPSSKTKDLIYRVSTLHSTTKDLDYVVSLAPVTIEKDLSYCVIKSYSITKDLDYVIKFYSTIQKGLVYKLIFIDTKQKSMEYSVSTVPSTVIDAYESTGEKITIAWCP